MRDAAQRHDGVAVRKVAHRLKSSCSVVAALALADLCEQLDQAALTIGPDELCAAIERIAAEFERVRAALEQERMRER